MDLTPKVVVRKLATTTAIAMAALGSVEAHSQGQPHDNKRQQAADYLAQLLNGDKGILPRGPQIEPLYADTEVNPDKQGFQHRALDPAVPVRDLKRQVAIAKEDKDCTRPYGFPSVPVYTDIGSNTYRVGLMYDDRTATLTEEMEVHNIGGLKAHTNNLFYGFYNGNRYNLRSDLIAVEPDYYRVIIPIPPEIPTPAYPKLPTC